MNSRVLVFISAQIVALSLPLLAFAQTAMQRAENAIVPCNGVDCSLCHLAQLAQNLINTGIFVAVFISALSFAYAGWLYLSSSIQEHTQAKTIILNVVIGLIVILGAWVFVDTLMKVLLNQGGTFMPWNSVCKP